MRQHVHAQLLLPPLHHLYVRQHALVLEPPRQLRRRRRGGVQARQAHELQHEPRAREVPNKGPERRLVEQALAQPVKARAQVVHELLTRGGGVDAGSDGAGDGEAWERGFEPEKVGVGRIGRGAFDGRREAGAVVVVPFSGAGDVPGEEDGGGAQRGRQSSAAGEREVGVLQDPVGVGVDR